MHHVLIYAPYPYSCTMSLFMHHILIHAPWTLPPNVSSLMHLHSAYRDERWSTERRYAPFNGSWRYDHRQNAYTLSEKARLPLPTCTHTCAFFLRIHKEWPLTKRVHTVWECTHTFANVHPHVCVLFTDPQGMTTNKMCTHCLRKHAHPCQRVPKRVRILTDPQGITTNNLCTQCLRMHAYILANVYPNVCAS